jgi:predicted transcriptional regulator YheO
VLHLDNIALENKAILDSYVNFLDFFAEMFGQQCEMVLHSVDGEKKSIIAIRNNNITGRKVGDETTELGTKILLNMKQNKYIFNTQLEEKLKKKIKISSYYIFNSHQDIIGIMCIIFDITLLLEAKNTLDAFLGMNISGINHVVHTDMNEVLDNENFCISKYSSDIIAEVIRETELPVDRMTNEERQSVISKLDELEIFKIKGAISETANQLKISIASMYRLLKN